MLYVGRSENVLARIGSHLSGRVVARREVASVSLIRCASLLESERLENRLIREHRPPWNTHGVARYGTVRYPVRRRAVLEWLETEEAPQPHGAAEGKGED